MIPLKRQARALILSGGLAFALPLFGEVPDWDVYGGPKLQLSLGLQAGKPSLEEDLRGHLGAGFGLFVGARFSERHAVRLSFDFTGSEVATWYYFFPNHADQIEYKDIWRVMRLGVEHELSLDASGRAYFLYGGGIQETWVNRTEGSLLYVALLGWSWANGATGGSTRYSSKATRLETIQPFASAGIGFKPFLSRRSSIELRYVAGPYQRYRDIGLRTQTDGATQMAMGHQLMLSFALHFGDY